MAGAKAAITLTEQSDPERGPSAVTRSVKISEQYRPVFLRNPFLTQSTGLQTHLRIEIASGLIQNLNHDLAVPPDR